MILHELGSRTGTEKETADTSKDNFRHQGMDTLGLRQMPYTDSLTEGLRCHELQEGHLRPRLMNDRTGPAATRVGTRNTQTAGTVMTNLTAVAHREGSGKILSSLTKCRLDGRTN